MSRHPLCACYFGNAARVEAEKVLLSASCVSTPDTASYRHCGLAQVCDNVPYEFFRNIFNVCKRLARLSRCDSFVIVTINFEFVKLRRFALCHVSELIVGLKIVIGVSKRVNPVDQYHQLEKIVDRKFCALQLISESEHAVDEGDSG